MCSSDVQLHSSIQLSITVDRSIVVMISAALLTQRLHNYNIYSKPGSGGGGGGKGRGQWDSEWWAGKEGNDMLWYVLIWHNIMCIT